MERRGSIPRPSAVAAVILVALAIPATASAADRADDQQIADDSVLTIDDRKAKGKGRRARRLGLPLGSLFEQALMVVLDQVVLDLMGSLGLTEALIATLTALGYEEPTPVQREAIPLMLAGHDLLAQASDLCRVVDREEREVPDRVVP